MRNIYLVFQRTKTWSEEKGNYCNSKRNFVLTLPGLPPRIRITIELSLSTSGRKGSWVAIAGGRDNAVKSMDIQLQYSTSNYEA